MADNAMGSFCLFNFIMYAVFAIIVSVHRDTFGALDGGSAGTNAGALSKNEYPEDDEQL